MFTIKVDGIKDFEDLRLNMVLYVDKLNETIKVNNFDMATSIQEVAKTHAPHDTGALRNAIVVVPVGDGSEYRIESHQPAGSNKPYNIFQEFGVPPQPKWTYNPRYGMITKEQADRKRVIFNPWPGFKGKRFMEKAFKWAIHEYPKSVERGVDLTIRRVFGQSK